MATSRAAELIGRADELGTLTPGRVADISVLRLDERDLSAVDSRRQELAALRLLTPVFAVRVSEVVHLRPANGP